MKIEKNKLEETTNDNIGFAIESPGPWGRIVDECEIELAEKVAGMISLRVPEGNVDGAKMKAIQNTVHKTVGEMLLSHAGKINAQTLGWTEGLATATDIELAETVKAKQLGEILEKCAGEDIISYLMKKMN